MVDWLKNLLAKTKLQNSAGLPSELENLLRTDLQALDANHPGLSDALLSYVLDGQNEEILLHVGGLADAASLLRLRYEEFRSTGQKGRPAMRQAFFKKGAAIPPIVLHRLGRVYEVMWDAAKGQWQWSHLTKDERWIEALLFEILEFATYNRKGKIDAGVISQTCVSGGLPSSTLARLILLQEPSYGYGYFHQPLVEGLSDIGVYLATELETVVQALSHEKAQHRAHVLELLVKTRFPAVGMIAERVLDLAVSESKTVREAAEKVLASLGESARSEIAPQVRRKLAEGSPGERANAVGLLSKIEGDACTGFLRERLAVETGKKVRAELEKYLGIKTVGGSGDNESGAYQDGLVAPQPRAFAVEYTFPSEMERDFVELMQEYSKLAVEEHANAWDRTKALWRHGKRDIDPPVDAKTATAIFKALSDDEQAKKGWMALARKTGNVKPSPQILHRLLGEYIQKHNLDLVPVIRLGLFIGEIQGSENVNYYFRRRIGDDALEWINGVLTRRYPDFNLLDLGAAFVAAGLSAEYVETLYTAHYWNTPFNRLNLPDEAIWPLFLVHNTALKGALGLGAPAADLPDYYRDDVRRTAFRILATFPKPPAEFVTHLWERALGSGRTDRPLAQACLRNYPNREKLIIQALSDGRKEIRTSAAQWLGELRATEAIEPIRKALAAEKQDESRAAMMEALERLGEDIDQFLNRKKLLEDAKKIVAQPVPKELAWFPFDKLPEVHWEKNKQTVPREVIRAFILQAFKLKKAEPGPLQRRYFAMMRPDERRALGNLILDSWLTQDTLPKYSQAEAEKEADKSTAQTKAYATQHPQWYPNFDEAQTRKQFLSHFLNECMGSASDSRGILAVAACCCGPDVVPRAEKYIRLWYGRRMTQAKSLIQMLSWIDHPLAIQLILAIGGRFRTKALQKEAAACADRIAERKGWTREEMADRTIPTAGFSRDGTQVIDYGVRKFTAKLMEDYSIELRNADGKVITALPDALKSEDEAEVKELKKDFSASRKELKQVLKLQQERLYEAMCTQRRWRYDEWESYLNAHPIVGRFCQQLVWLVFRGDELAASFRPLPDGSLTDYDDNPVNLNPDDEIQVAHQLLLPETDVAKWQEHLKDYEVPSLFSQFGKKLFQSGDNLSKLTEITEFEGYLVNSFKLRGRSGKLGYIRGSAEDGGWFYLYTKPFPGLKMQAAIEFTGNTLPEEDRTVALRKLYFVRLQDNANDSSGYAHRPIKLSEVPKVMLAECWNDIKLMADDGSGYDKDWEKAAAY